MEVTLRHLVNRLNTDTEMLKKQTDEHNKEILKRRIEQHKSDILACVLKAAQNNNSHLDCIAVE